MLPKQDCKYTDIFQTCKFDFTFSKHFYRNSVLIAIFAQFTGDVLVLTASDIGRGSLTPFSKTKKFYLLIDFLLKVFFLSNLIRIFVALYGTIAL